MPPLPTAAAAHAIACRPLIETDMDFVAELYASTRIEELKVTGWPAAAQEAFLRQQHHAQHAHYTRHFADAEFLIVECAGEPIGRLYLRDLPDRLHIVDISLAPAARGGGVGGAILRDLIAQAHGAGKPVTIRLEKANRARRLYERLGFVVTGDLGAYDEMAAPP